MAQFLRPALATLNKIYNIVGGRVSSDEIDVASPIQLVHDVSREAELGAIGLDPRLGGYFQLGVDNTHVGATTVHGAPDPYVVLDAAFGPDSSERIWAWLCWYGASNNSIGAVTRAILSLQIGALSTAFIARDILIARFNADTESNAISQNWLFYSGAAAGTDQIVAPQVSPGAGLPLPMFVGSKLGWRSISTANVVCRLSTICWAGPIGVYPPGMK